MEKVLITSSKSTWVYFSHVYHMKHYLSYQLVWSLIFFLSLKWCPIMWITLQYNFSKYQTMSFKSINMNQDLHSQNNKKRSRVSEMHWRPEECIPSYPFLCSYIKNLNLRKPAQFTCYCQQIWDLCEERCNPIFYTLISTLSLLLSSPPSSKIYFFFSLSNKFLFFFFPFTHSISSIKLMCPLLFHNKQLPIFFKFNYSIDQFI